MKKGEINLPDIRGLKNPDDLLTPCRFLCLEIRDLFNNLLAKRVFKTKSYEWAVAVSAMDMLNDSIMAIECFLNLPRDKNDSGMMYLSQAGLFQSIIIHHDSVISMYYIATGKTLNPNNDKNLKKLRKLRNVTYGHPANHKKNTTSLVQINRNSSNLDIIEFIEYEVNDQNYKADSFNKVPVQTVIATQLTWSILNLTTIRDTLSGKIVKIEGKS